MVVPQLTYTRLIYSATPHPPSLSCNRTVTGSVSYKVIGWHPTPENGYFLIPMMAVNLVSLIILAVLIFKKAMRGGYEYDPLQPNSLPQASPDSEGGGIKWEDVAKYHREVRGYHLRQC